VSDSDTLSIDEGWLSGRSLGPPEIARLQTSTPRDPREGGEAESFFATLRKKFANGSAAFNRTSHLALAGTLLSRGDGEQQI
jgi:hypothetical protein